VRQESIREPWSPWRHLREQHSDVCVYELELPPGLLGCVDHEQRIIWLDSRLTQAERRCTLAHEIGHLERGPGPCDPLGGSIEERLIDEWAARQLIDGDSLARAFQWSPFLPEIATELWVDLHMLRTRLRAATDEEQDRIMSAIYRLREPA
jgi:hypothetical protein